LTGRGSGGGVRLTGLIAGAGFASGDRFVVGHWQRSPLGPMDDLMWATPSGQRRLLAPTRPVADFVSALYRFEEVIVTRLRVDASGGNLRLTVADLGLALDLEGGRRWPIPLIRTRWVTRHVAAAPARRLLGVDVYGTTATGVHEWYQASAYRPVRRGRATLDGVDLGALRPILPPTRFGFSEPPRRPSLVEVSPLLVDPSGRLDRLFAPGPGSAAAT
jgi:hypothetical protein